MVAVSSRQSKPLTTNKFYPFLQVFAIFAFATTGCYSGVTHFTVKCPQAKEELVEAKFGYPFRYCESLKLHKSYLLSA